MKKFSSGFFFVVAFCLSAIFVSAQQTGIIKSDISQAELDKIINAVSNNENDLRGALTGYVFKRLATVQTIGMGGQITGTFRRDSFMTFGSDGVRFEKILFAPISTLKDIKVSAADLEDLGGITPFALIPSDIPLYNFNYLGKEKIDELNLHVIEVSPKVIPNPKKSTQRVFQGRIWVDDLDLMIVKSKGKALPEGKDMQGMEQRFPVVETWRENIEGKYWFPAFATADDELVFNSGFVVKLKVRVKYTDYAQGKSTVTILGDEEPVEDIPAPRPTPVKP